MQALSIAVAAVTVAIAGIGTTCAADENRPNILFCIADDWGYPHAGAYGDPVVKTPTFDRLAREGVLFQHAYVSSPSCTPSRGAILTGQYHWRLAGAGNLHSVFPDKFDVYPEILQDAGYAIGSTGKAWGPGRTETKARQLAGERFQTFSEFLERRPADQPFCFWLGSSDPHRPYEPGSGEESGMDLDAIRLPAAFPDDPIVRSDVADYYFEVQRFDSLVGDAVDALESAGLLDDTIILMTGDHGMPFPRGKSNIYDLGVRVPLAIRWPGARSADRTVRDFVSLTDLAPTFLELAGLDVPGEMTGRSLVPLLKRESDDQIEDGREFVVFGKERHVPSQEAPDMGGYPCRGIRTHDYLYIRNFRPDRWPNGTPHYERAAVPGNWYADTDNGPTKTYIIENRDRDDAHQRFYELSFAKRPGEELYDLSTDPEQLSNVAGEMRYADVQRELATRLTAVLKQTGDPRIAGNGDMFDQFEYLGGGPKHPDWKPEK
ncbi:MAG: heparan N-sulfatase [Planctomycetota bacterium]|nr:MAG: heparan N-sulfatase [Planctomycetota bacterium]REK35731.1 MAG: heparan N-sulfatase [Planctomycetota bacterium]